MSFVGFLVMNLLSQFYYYYSFSMGKKPALNDQIVVSWRILYTSIHINLDDCVSSAWHWWFASFSLLLLLPFCSNLHLRSYTMWSSVRFCGNHQYHWSKKKPSSHLAQRRKKTHWHIGHSPQKWKKKKKQKLQKIQLNSGFIKFIN